jgi:hypothetical protein
VASIVRLSVTTFHAGGELDVSIEHFPEESSTFLGAFDLQHRIALGTHPDRDIAGMDLTLEISHHSQMPGIQPFGDTKQCGHPVHVRPKPPGQVPVAGMLAGRMGAAVIAGDVRDL